MVIRVIMVEVLVAHVGTPFMSKAHKGSFIKS